MAEKPNRPAAGGVAANQEQERQTEIVDFKMVTFSLGGKDYGIDIMKVKEISKANLFTYVPNTASFVRGVYNLRGEIISIVDLRRMFNIPAPERPEGEPDDIVFLRFEDHLIGAIVDEINDVAGVSSARIQPPHPLFGDINIKFIDGVVEHNGNLFIVLDTDMIFGHDAMQTDTPAEALPSSSIRPGSEPEEAVTADTAIDQFEAGADVKQLSFSFLRQTLATFSSFHVSPVNENWVRSRIDQWLEGSSDPATPVQLGSREEADRFLAAFYSRHVDELWPSDFAAGMVSAFSDIEARVITVWNIGCGRGHDAYSLAVALRHAHPNARIKLWAHDNDLLKISTAPNLVLEEEPLPVYLQHMVEGANGFTFTEDIKDLILFEYHDVRHENSFPPMNIVVARDIISFLNDKDRMIVLAEMYERTTPGGILIMGDNEVMPDSRWTEVKQSAVKYYIKD